MRTMRMMEEDLLLCWSKLEALLRRRHHHSFYFFHTAVAREQNTRQSKQRLRLRVQSHSMRSFPCHQQPTEVLPLKRREKEGKISRSKNIMNGQIIIGENIPKVKFLKCSWECFTFFRLFSGICRYNFLPSDSEMCGFIARSCLHAEYDSHSTFPSSRISSSFSIVDAEINRNRCVWCFPVFQIDLFLTLTYTARPRYGSGAVRYGTGTWYTCTYVSRFWFALVLLPFIQ